MSCRGTPARLATSCWRSPSFRRAISIVPTGAIDLLVSAMSPPWQDNPRSGRRQKPPGRPRIEDSRAFLQAADLERVRNMPRRAQAIALHEFWDAINEPRPENVMRLEIPPRLRAQAVQNVGE